MEGKINILGIYEVFLNHHIKKGNKTYCEKKLWRVYNQYQDNITCKVYIANDYMLFDMEILNVKFPVFIDVKLMQ